MKKRLIVYGFSSKAESGIIEELKGRGDVEVAFWLASRHSPDSVGNLNRCRLDLDSYAPYDISAYDEVKRNFFEYFCCHNRQKQVFLRREKFYDYIDFFNRYFQRFHKLLKDVNPDAVVFNNIPHLGPDIMLYYTAKALGVKTVMFYQSLFPNRVFCLNSIDDFSRMGELPVLGGGTYEIKRTFKKDLFYMKKRAGGLFNGITKPSRLYFAFINLAKMGYAIQHKRRLKAATCASPDLEGNFVYFPLHLQPELTTNPLGGEYADQMLAIEHLSNMLPDDWLICVKENPYQDEYRRGRAFFERLAAVKKARLVPGDTSTYELMEKCRFVATVTGTAGWEAITGGKNALVFGQAWYKTLPGVFEFSKSLKLDDILNYRLDHAELQEAVNGLYGRLGCAIMNTDYGKNYPGYDEAQNRKAASDLIARLV